MAKARTTPKELQELLIKLYDQEGLRPAKLAMETACKQHGIEPRASWIKNSASFVYLWRKQIGAPPAPKRARKSSTAGRIAPTGTPAGIFDLCKPTPFFKVVPWTGELFAGDKVEFYNAEGPPAGTVIVCVDRVIGNSVYISHHTYQIPKLISKANVRRRLVAPIVTAA